ncbi:hypothetical protein quinque_010046 [Culex quinquefasciatus]
MRCKVVSVPVPGRAGFVVFGRKIHLNGIHCVRYFIECHRDCREPSAAKRIPWKLEAFRWGDIALFVAFGDDQLRLGQQTGALFGAHPAESRAPSWPGQFALEDLHRTKACVEPARSVFLLRFIQKQDLDRTFRFDKSCVSCLSVAFRRTTTRNHILELVSAIPGFWVLRPTVQNTTKQNKLPALSSGQNRRQPQLAHLSSERSMARSPLT